MTTTKPHPRGQVQHNSKCIEPYLIEEDEVARIIAEGYDLTEPVEFDYEVARKVIAYIVTCSKAGQIAHWSAAGLSNREIAEQLGLSVTSVERLAKSLREEA